MVVGIVSSYTEMRTANGKDVPHHTTIEVRDTETHYPSIGEHHHQHHFDSIGI
jgi:hypothetical protein